MIVLNNYLTEGVSFSDAMDKALQEAHNQSDFVLIKEGEYKADRTIAITNEKYTNCRGIIGEDRTRVKIWADRAQTIDWNPDLNNTDARYEALILLERVDHKVISAISLHYKGEFYRSGKSYFGSVNGIYLEHTNQCKVANVEIQGCNRAGVFLNTVDRAVRGEKATKHYYNGLDPKQMGLPKGNVITNCILHHNRVAGVLGGWQEDLVIRGNHCYRNGHERDGGTGYGVALSSGAVNTNYLYEKNLVEYNYRKGLDVHDGFDGTITDNQVFCNRFHGIAIEHRGYPGKNCIITNNHITFDNDFRLDRDDEVPEGQAINPRQDYYQQRAIRIELKPQQWQKWANEVPDPKYVIEGNRISGLSSDDRGEHRVLELYNKNNSDDVTPNWTIRNNIINCGKVAYVAFIDAAPDCKNGLGNVTIDNNYIIADWVEVAPFTIQEATKVKFGEGRAIKFENNYLQVTSVNSGAKAIHYNGTVETYSVKGNNFNLVPNINRPVMRFQCNLDGKADALKWSCANNTFTLALANIHIFKGATWWATDKSKVTMSGNVHHLVYKIPLDDKVVE